MNEFLRFFNTKLDELSMHMEIYYSKVMDWSIRVWRKGAGDNGEDVTLVQVQDVDMELCFAKAHVQLKEWLLEHEGGY